MTIGQDLGSVSEWERKVLTMIAALANLLDSTHDPLRIWMRNHMELLLLTTEPGATIPSGMLTREEMLMYSAFFQSALRFRDRTIVAYLDANGDPVTMSPDDVLGYRRMPQTVTPPEGYVGAPIVNLVSQLPLSAPGLAAVPPPQE